MQVFSKFLLIFRGELFRPQPASCEALDPRAREIEGTKEMQVELSVNLLKEE
jgi:hypothetical protein